VSLVNLNPHTPAQLNCDLRGAKVSKFSGRVLTSETMQAHNTFDQPAAVKPAAFNDCQIGESGFTVKLPAKSVVMLELE